MSPAVARALADMREGFRVLIVAPSRDAIAGMLAEARQGLRPGESARHTQGVGRIDGCPSAGWIHFVIYASVIHGGSGRGMSVDRVYVDHAELVERLAPTMVCSPDGLDVTHC